VVGNSAPKAAEVALEPSRTTFGFSAEVVKPWIGRPTPKLGCADRHKAVEGRGDARVVVGGELVGVEALPRGRLTKERVSKSESKLVGIETALGTVGDRGVAKWREKKWDRPGYEMVVGETRVGYCHGDGRQVGSGEDYVECAAEIVRRKVYATGQTVGVKHLQKRASVRVIGPLNVDVEIPR